MLITRTLDSTGNETGTTTHYLHKDHLGSLDIITDETGAIVQQLSFDAWGARRNALSWTQLTAPQLTGFDHSLITRGFTGHEMLDEVGLVHMNGRIYDARTGRFLQADPVLQFPDYTQSYNRYSYVLNNPLTYNDPSGYVIPFVVAAIQITATAAAVNGAIYVSTAMIISGIAGFAGVMAQGGSFQNGLIAGLSAAAFTGLGADFGLAAGSSCLSSATMARYALGFATVGGITSQLQGGTFGHGFVSAGVGFIAGGTLFAGAGNAALKNIGRIILGGTLSKATGGKFANGAAYAAFAAIVSEAAEAVTSSDGGENRTITDPDKIAAIDADLEVANREALNVNGSEKDVVGWAKQKSLSLQKKHAVEFGGTIVKNGDSFGIGRVVTDYQTHRLPSLSRLGGYAHFHTHPGTNTFSTGDLSVGVVNRLTKSYVFHPGGSAEWLDVSGYRKVHDWRSLRHYVTPQEAATAGDYIHAY